LSFWDRERISLCSIEDPRCEFGLRGGWAIVQRAVGSEGVVFLVPPFDEYLGLPEGIQDHPIE